LTRHENFRDNSKNNLSSFFSRDLIEQNFVAHRPLFASGQQLKHQMIIPQVLATYLLARRNTTGNLLAKRVNRAHPRCSFSRWNH